MPKEKSDVKDSASSSALALAAAAAARRSASQSSTRSDCGGKRSSTARSARRTRHAMKFESLEHLTASAALPKQQRSST
eukprot:3577781-Prymnesium_polylepis.1